MRPVRKIQTFNDRYPLMGPALWMVSVQYFIIQFIVAAAWIVPYSLSKNAISDLGNTACGFYVDRYVCSPLHGLMNLSFIVLGLTMLAGAMLIFHEFHKSWQSALGFAGMGAAGIGTILVGLFPENTVGVLHFIGAMMPFLVGNLAMVLLGFVLDVPRYLRYYTLFSGLISLLALALFLTHTYLGLGLGGMERIVAYPQTAWLIIFGVYISQNHFRKAGLSSS